MKDSVDGFMEQWAKERPDLDASPMGVIGRLHRLAPRLDAELRPVFASAGLANGEFDILASLRRSGAPYELTPTQLSRALMITGGAVTKRVDRLVAAGLVRRDVSQQDARGRLIGLTPEGLQTVDDLATRHFANEARLLEPLTPREREQLGNLLRKLLIEHD